MKRLMMLLMVVGLLFMGVGLASAYTLDFEDLDTEDLTHSYHGFLIYAASEHLMPAGSPYRDNGTSGSYSIYSTAFDAIQIFYSPEFDLQSFDVATDADLANGGIIVYQGYEYGNPNPVYSVTIGPGLASATKYTIDVSSWSNIYELRVSAANDDPYSNGYTGAHVCLDNIVYNAVPIPGAVWLLGSGLIGLAGIRRRLKGQR